MPRTLFDKVWDAHVVVAGDGAGPDLLNVDLSVPAVHPPSAPSVGTADRRLSDGRR
jgi:homoaconitase/3-isopropylmalate dehydratase large subunit